MTRAGDRLTRPALGSTATLVVEDPAALPMAERVLERELAAIDDACSRFRPDSEISRVHTRPEEWVEVGPVLAAALAAAWRAAELTGGLVDPTVGRAVRELGYDRDFATLRPSSSAAPTGRPAPGWRRVGWDAPRAAVLLPAGIELDLGASAKALAADRVATGAAAATGCGVLVSLGGDTRADGPVPSGGWRLGVGDDHERAREQPDAMVTVTGGAVASSGVTRRRWRRADRWVHHIVDPRTGDPADGPWRTASVAAATCVDANTASTAAIVLGAQAPDWLARRRLPARLVGTDGRVVTVAGWPDPDGEG